MKETTPHRPIKDIWNELSNHPDYVAGTYYDKEALIDNIANELQDGSYDDEEKLYTDAEELINNNLEQINWNIHISWSSGMEHCIFSDYCDLPEKQIKNK